MSTMLAEAREGFQEGVEIYLDTWKQLIRYCTGVLKSSKDDTPKGTP